MRVAARLERAVAHDQRRYARRPVQISAGLGVADRTSSAVTVVDLSTHGCGIELDSHVDAGARVWIALPGLENWAARVMWAQQGRAGLAFDRPMHQAVVDRYR
jgi:inactivated superfamily I helicase